MIFCFSLREKKVQKSEERKNQGLEEKNFIPEIWGETPCFPLKLGRFIHKKAAGNRYKCQIPECFCLTSG